MKEYDSVTAHISAYETLIVQLSSQGMSIEDKLRALILLSNLPPSWETFVTTICNASIMAMTYASATGSIISEDARHKSFEQSISGEAYIVQDTGVEAPPEARAPQIVGASLVTPACAISGRIPVTSRLSARPGLSRKRKRRLRESYNTPIDPKR